MKSTVPLCAKAARLVLTFFLALASCSRTSGATLPPGFVEEPIGGTWDEACGVTFDSTGCMYVWERAGRVWIVETNGVRLTRPLIDISEEVGGWRDLGMLGFALDPQFETNGHIYLLYVVDRHHLKHFGTPSYDPNANEYFQATIGRVTRYTARSSDGFHSVDPASRQVLLGESISTGFPILHQSHGPGTLLFGTDGTLFASAGEGSSYTGVDAGGSVGENYAEQALADGIIQPKENVGAYRAQLVDSLSGKIIRIDPATGDGVPGNPFYVPSNPRFARSRVWALGLRNPYRMTLRPGTGSTNRADANPGVIYVGDVGWSTWEELNVVTGPGKNFGWPIFEGMDVQSEYFDVVLNNWDAPNPLYRVNGCRKEYFSFHDLLHVDTLDPDPSFPNPCDPSQQIPSSIPHFIHSRPAIDWRESARTSTYDTNGNPTIARIGQKGSPVSGSQFAGKCTVAGTWYVGSDFPSNYMNTYFNADFDAGWIQNFVFDTNNRPVSVRSFLTNAGAIVAVATHPTQGGLYYVRWGMEVLKICYSSDGNRAPTAIASADRTHGASPLTVQFTGTNSLDPEGSPLIYQWDFGDGSVTNITANPSHTFQAPAELSTNFTVTLTVADTNKASATAVLVISVNSTPPSVTITNPVDGSKYPMTGDTLYQLRANVSDAEHADSQLEYRWQTFLHHNDHQHSEAVDTNHATSTVISPIGCNGETYYFRITLIVTDPTGLSATNEVKLYPDCPAGGVGDPFPALWMHRDIGAVSAAGNASYSNRLFTVTGSGADIWGSVDAFHYAYWHQNGDGEIIARVASQENTDPWAKAGIMIRETLEADSKYALAGIAPSGLLFQSRSATGRETDSQTIVGTNAPFWLKLVRSGNVFTSYASPDGVTWVTIDSATIAMTNAAFGGFAVTSHRDGTLSMTMFDHIAARDSSPPAPRLSWLPREQTNGLTLKIEGPAGASYELQASLDLMQWASVTMLTNSTGVTFYTDSNLQNAPQRFFRVSIAQ